VDSVARATASSPRPLPASHQHREFVVATHKGREAALPGAAPAAARPNNPVKRHRLRHAFEFVAAALLGDKHPGDLALYPRRHHHSTRLGKRLRPRRDVRHISENLA